MKREFYVQRDHVENEYICEVNLPDELIPFKNRRVENDLF